MTHPSRTDDLTEIELLLDRIHREISGIHAIMRYFKIVVVILLLLMALDGVLTYIALS